MASHLIVVGLTGGIASGKSTVAETMRQAGMPVIDADSLGRLVLDRGTEAYEQTVATFGKEILDETGDIDRQRLGSKVFQDPAAREKLESITHPAIAAMAKRGLELIAKRGEPIAIYEAALLVETGIYKGLSALIVVSCSLETQLARLRARDGLGNAAAAARIASQYPLEEKLKAADYVISTDGTFQDVETRTREVLLELRNRFLNN